MVTGSMKKFLPLFIVLSIVLSGCFPWLLKSDDRFKSDLDTGIPSTYLYLLRDEQLHLAASHKLIKLIESLPESLLQKHRTSRAYLPTIRRELLHFFLYLQDQEKHRDPLALPCLYPNLFFGLRVYITETETAFSRSPFERDAFIRALADGITDFANMLSLSVRYVDDVRQANVVFRISPQYFGESGYENLAGYTKEIEPVRFVESKKFGWYINKSHGMMYINPNDKRIPVFGTSYFPLAAESILDLKSTRHTSRHELGHLTGYYGWHSDTQRSFMYFHTPPYERIVIPRTKNAKPKGTLIMATPQHYYCIESPLAPLMDDPTGHAMRALKALIVSYGPSHKARFFILW